MPKLKLTKTSISDLVAGKSIIDYFDTEVRGLVLRLFPNGTKVFAIIYRNSDRKLRRYTVGKYPSIQLLQAKKEAQRLLLLIAQGEDIQQNKTKSRQNAKKTEFTLRDYLDDFYAHWCHKNRKDGVRIMLTLMNACQPLHNKALNDIDHSTVNKFLMAYQKKNQVSNARLNRILNTLKGAISRAFEYGYLEKNSLQGLKTFKESVGKIRYLSKAETQKLFDALETTDELIKNIVMTAYYTGMRRGEIFSLRWEDIDLNLNQIILDNENTKSGKIRDIPINSKLRDIFLSLPEPKTGLVFKSPVTNTNFNNIRKSWITLMKKAGIENFRFHDLRHNFASQLVMKGENLSVVRELLGHSDFKMTLRYAHLAPEHKQRAVDLL